MATIKIGSRLPMGLILELNGIKQEIAGLNASRVIGAEYTVSEIDKDFFDAWVKANPEFQPIANGSIFAITARDEKATAKEKSANKTGLEPIDPNSHGVKSAAGA